MNVKLYTTHCPRCNVLEKKLNQKNINFEVITDFDINEMIEKGFSVAPILSVDNELMDFSKANTWINTL